MTTTPTVTLADVHQFAGDFLARTDLAIHGVYVYPRSIGLMLEIDGAYASLAAPYETFDDATVTLTDHATEEAPHQVILSVDGKYRGVYASAQTTVTASADLDLIRSFTDENKRPDGRLLDALVGDSATQPECAS
jgi:hypothetical protein